MRWLGWGFFGVLTVVASTITGILLWVIFVDPSEFGATSGEYPIPFMSRTVLCRVPDWLFTWFPTINKRPSFCGPPDLFTRVVRAFFFWQTALQGILAIFAAIIGAGALWISTRTQLENSERKAANEKDEQTRALAAALAAEIDSIHAPINTIWLDYGDDAIKCKDAVLKCGIGHLASGTVFEATRDRVGFLCSDVVRRVVVFYTLWKSVTDRMRADQDNTDTEWIQVALQDLLEIGRGLPQDLSLIERLGVKSAEDRIIQRRARQFESDLAKTLENVVHCEEMHVDSDKNGILDFSKIDNKGQLAGDIDKYKKINYRYNKLGFAFIRDYEDRSAVETFANMLEVLCINIGFVRICRFEPDRTKILKSGREITAIINERESEIRRIIASLAHPEVPPPRVKRWYHGLQRMVGHQS